MVLRTVECLLICVMLVSLCNADYQPFNISFKAGKFLDSVHFTMDLADIATCSRFCQKLSVCKSFNFDKGQGKCHLNNETKNSAPDALIASVGSIYSDIESWPKNAAGPCFKQPCSSSEFCMVQHPSTDTFYCIQILACPAPEDIENTAHTPTPPLSEIGRRVTYTCNYPFNWTLDTDVEMEVQCLSHGQWSKPQFACSACPSPPAIRNASITILSHNSVSYNCSENFWSSGTPSVLECLPDGTWTNTSFQCSECGDPPQVQHARQINVQTTGIAMATYECMCPQPYSQTMIGTPTATCTQDGWHVQFTCNIDCYTDPALYVGERNTTKDGITCQSWVDDFLHKNNYHGDTFYPDSSEFAAGNKCRSPDKESDPWCYTLSPDVTWGYCGVPSCSSCSHYYWRQSTGTFIECDSLPSIQYAREVNGPATDVSKATYECTCPQPYSQTLFGTPVATCTADGWNIDFSCSADCYNVSDYNIYMGERNTTIGGIACQQWVDDDPHYSNFHGDALFPDSSEIAAGNKCRSPDRTYPPWCYTMSPGVRWDYCGVPQCSDC